MTWKLYRQGQTTFTSWPRDQAKRYLVVLLETRGHGTLTLLLPPSATEALLRLETALAERGQEITEVDLVVQMVDRGGYSHAVFAEARSVRPRTESSRQDKEAAG